MKLAIVLLFLVSQLDICLLSSTEGGPDPQPGDGDPKLWNRDGYDDPSQRDGDRPDPPKRDGDQPDPPKRDGDQPDPPKRDGDQTDPPKRDGDHLSPEKRDGDLPDPPPLCNNLRITGMGEYDGDYKVHSYRDSDDKEHSRLHFNFIYVHHRLDILLLWSTRDPGTTPFGFWTLGPTSCYDPYNWKLCGFKDPGYSEPAKDNKFGYEPWAGVWPEGVSVTCNEKPDVGCDWLRDNTCYIFFYKDRQNRENARQHCERIKPGKSRLAAPITMAENRYLQHKILGYYPNIDEKNILINFEIGEVCHPTTPGNPAECLNVWGYRDSHNNLIQLPYTDFYPGGQHGECAIYKSYHNITTGRYDIPLWSLVDCSQELPFICEVKMDTEEMVPAGCKCGVKMAPAEISNDYIYGGETSDANAWPWQVVMYYHRSHGHACLGSIISTKEILTAAHCVVDRHMETIKDIRYIEVVIGDVFKGSIDPEEKWLPVCAVKFHPEYHFAWKSDLAILVLCDELDFNTVASPICLPKLSGRHPAYNEEVVALILGRSPEWNERNYSQAAVFTMQNEGCMQDALRPHEPWDGGLYPLGFISEDQLCTYYPERGVNYGDSGGPLMTRTSRSWYQIGVVHGGVVDTSEDSPQIHMRITSFTDWIKDTVGSPTCPPQHGACGPGECDIPGV